MSSEFASGVQGVANARGRFVRKWIGHFSPILVHGDGADGGSGFGVQQAQVSAFAGRDEPAVRRDRDSVGLEHAAFRFPHEFAVRHVSQFGEAPCHFDGHRSKPGRESYAVRLSERQ